MKLTENSNNKSTESTEIEKQKRAEFLKNKYSYVLRGGDIYKSSFDYITYHFFSIISSIIEADYYTNDEKVNRSKELLELMDILSDEKFERLKSQL